MRVVAVLALTLLGTLAGCSQPDTGPGTLLGTATECSPVGRPCTVRSGGRTISLTLPADLQPLTRFDLGVEVTGVQPQAVVIDFAMAGMDMGVNRFALRGSGRHWRGEAIVPICTTGRVDWLATVEAQTAQGPVRAVFPFSLTP